MKYVINIFKNLSLLSRPKKTLLQIILDSLVFITSIFISSFLAYSNFDFIYDSHFFLINFLALITCISFFLFDGMYKNIIRHASIQVFKSSLKGILASILMMVTLLNILEKDFTASLLILFYFFFTSGISQSRIFVKFLYQKIIKANRKLVAVYGAGRTGIQLARYMNATNEYKVVMFIDDDPDINGYKISGIEVFNFNQSKKLFNTQIVSILLIAMPNIKSQVKKNILEQLKNYPIKVKIIPPIENIIENKLDIDKFKSVTITDLLNRAPILPISELMSKNIQNKNVLVSGAGGSIGSQLCKEILLLKPKKLVLLDISEISLFNIANELNDLLEVNGLSIEIISITVSIQNKIQLEKHIKIQKIYSIFHAAAYKHVHLVEQNPFEAINNNVFGTKNLAEIAIDTNVKSFVLISSDKAVRPTNIMGATKRIAELICFNKKMKEAKTNFSVVRFGNVLASSGSVIPVFEKQIKKGGPITVSHKKVTRYFMTVSEAAQLVIQASSMSTNQDVFILDMGKPVKIFDIAKKMVQLQGLVPYIDKKDNFKKGDIPIIITGLRTGEKLYEELLVGKKGNPTVHPRIMSEKIMNIDTVNFNKLLKNLKEICSNHDRKRLIETLQNSEIGFNYSLNE